MFKSSLKNKKKYKNIITIIIPRHLNNIQDIKFQCKELNLKYQVLSDGELIKPNKEIIIINSYGVMSKYLKNCKSVFIGKSVIKKLEKVGGQNPIEAAKLGCKIYNGPYVYNFKEIYALFKKLKISETIFNYNDLSNKLIIDLSKPNKVNNNKINVINNYGKKILTNTYNSLLKVAF